MKCAFTTALTVGFAMGVIAASPDVWEAAITGDAALLRAILKTNQGTVNATNGSGTPLLHVASSPDTIRELLAAKADPNARNLLRETALHVTFQRLLHPVVHPVYEKFGLSKTNLSVTEFVTVLTNLASDTRLWADVLQTRAPLSAAQLQAEAAILRLLIKAGADIEATNCVGAAPLFMAAQHGEPELLRILLESKANPNHRNLVGLTPLHIAARWANAACIEQLVKAGADVNARDQSGATPLFSAARTGNRQTCQALLENGANVFATTENAQTAAHAAARAGDPDCLKLMLDHGAFVNGKASGGMTPLHIAAFEGFPTLVEFLLSRHALVDVRDDAGFTPFLSACENGYYECAKLLVEAGADATARPKNPIDALALACGTTNVQMVSWLLNLMPPRQLNRESLKTAVLQTALFGRPANFHVVFPKARSVLSTNDLGQALCFAAGGRTSAERQRAGRPGPELGTEEEYDQVFDALLLGGAATSVAGYTSLHWACAGGNAVAARKLLDLGLDVNAATSQGKTPLHLAAAACPGRAGLANLLVERGANLEKPDNYGFTPLRDAASVGNNIALRELLAHKSNISARDRYAATPLHWAALTNALSVVILVEAGAAIEARDNAQRTALHQAAAGGREDIVEALLRLGANPQVADVMADSPANAARKQGFVLIAQKLDEAAKIKRPVPNPEPK